jgi:hypothetical protein
MFPERQVRVIGKIVVIYYVILILCQVHGVPLCIHVLRRGCNLGRGQHLCVYMDYGAQDLWGGCPGKTRSNQDKE